MGIKIRTQTLKIEVGSSQTNCRFIFSADCCSESADPSSS